MNTAHHAARIFGHIVSRNVVNSLGTNVNKVQVFRNLERGFRGTSMEQTLDQAKKSLELVRILDAFDDQRRSKKYLKRIADYVGRNLVNPRKIKNARGYTLLMYAAHYGDKTLVNTLIRKKVNVNAVDTDGWTALTHHAAFTHVQPDGIIAKNLINAGAHVNPASALMHAASLGHRKLVAVLLNAGANVNYVDTEMLNWTPLIMAVQDVDPEAKMVKMMIKAGANVNAVDIYGYSALDLIDGNNPYKAVLTSILRDAGAM